MTRALPLLTLLLTLTFVGSSFFTGFDGFDGGQVPIPQEDPPIQPAGWAFSIWILIYGWLIVSAAYGVWRRADDRDWDRVRLPLVLSLAIGTPWLAVAAQSAVWATVMIFAMAATAIWALLEAPAKNRWFLRAPVGLYAGWLTAASFVSLGSTAAGYGLLTPLAWAYVGIPLALIVALMVQLRKPMAPAYGAAVAWALLGIAVANSGTYTGVTILAGFGIAVIAGAALRGGRHRAA